MVTLDQIMPGKNCVVRRVSGMGQVSQRLLELGFMENTSVSVLRYAPLGDPMQIKIRGCHFAIRRSEAALIEVDLA